MYIVAEIVATTNPVTEVTVSNKELFAQNKAEVIITIGSADSINKPKIDIEDLNKRTEYDKSTFSFQ